MTAPATIESRSFCCAALERDVPYSVFVPPGPAPTGGWPLVFLLHGAGRHHRSIADDPASARDVRNRPFVTVFPDGKLGWYVDNPSIPGSRYQFMLRELLALARSALPVNPSPARTAFCGWSMGGFGAVRFVEDYPDEANTVATLIALLDFPNPVLPQAQNHAVPDVLGDDSRLWSPHNCMTRADRLRGKTVWFFSARNAFDLTMNQNFHQRLDALGIAHIYVEEDGDHDWPTVARALPHMLNTVQKALAPNDERPQDEAARGER